MPEFFVLLLAQVTVFSSITAMLLLIIKRFFRKRIPPMLSMILWLILVIRLLIPLLPESSFSIYNLVPVGRNIMFTLTYDHSVVNEDVADNPAYSSMQEGENPYEIHPQEAGSASASDEPGTTGTNWHDRDIAARRRELCTWILLLYLAGAVLIGGVQLFMYERALYRVRSGSSPCFDNHLQHLFEETARSLGISSKRIPELCVGSTAMLAGIWKPCVILQKPEEDEVITDREYQMIFTHELNHYKHRDNLILVLASIVCTIFWYNPLLWLIRSMFREDLEMLCDTRTLDHCGINAKEYARMLCRSSRLTKSVSAEALGAGSAMSASGRLLKLRLINISHSRKGGFLPRTVSFLLCFTMVAICLTNPIVSAENEYAVYIENSARITGMDVRDLYLEDQVTVHRFLQQFHDMLTASGGEVLSRSVGNGSLENLKRLAADSPYVDAAVADALEQLKPAEELDMENCALLLSALTGIISEGRRITEVTLLPEMISVDTMSGLCRNLSEPEAALLYACYNKGVSGADVEFEYVYTNAMMELISERINDDWAKEKFRGYYQEINLSPEDLGQISAYLNETIRYVGIGKEFYLCDPGITRQEEKVLREILGAAVAGQREDVYYLKDTEDGCSYDTAESLFIKAGLTVADMYAEYARLGVTTYTCTRPDDYVLISEYDLQEFAGRLQDNSLIDAFRQTFTYYETYTYTDDSGTEMTVPFRYYAVSESTAEEGQAVIDSMLQRLNAAAFPPLAKTGSVEITGTLSDAARYAALEAVELGFIDTDDGVLSLQNRVTSGQCAQILCRFMAAVTNVNT